MKRFLPILFFVAVLFFGITHNASAATRTIADGGGNWNAVGTWVEGAFPTSADDVVATATSGQLTVNVSSAAKSINFTGYTNTLTMNALLTVSGDVTLVSAMTISGSSGLTVNAAAILTSNTKTWPNALSLTSNVVYTLADDWTVSGTLSLGGGGGGTSTINAFTINAGGSLTVNNQSYSVGTTAIVLNGTGTWSESNVGSGYLANNLTINTAGTVTISGSVDFSSGTFTYTTGTVVTTGSTVTFSAITSGSNFTGITTWNNLSLNGSGTTLFTIGSGTSIGGSLSLSGLSETITLLSDIQVGSLNVSMAGGGTATINDFNLSVSGSFNSAQSCFTAGTTVIVLNGTGIWSASSIGSGSIKSPVTINTAGTITVSGTIPYNTGTLTYTAGTVITTSSTLKIAATTTLDTNGIGWNNVTLSGTSTDTLSSDLTVNGTLTVS